MNLDTHIRDIWIAIGVLSALGILLAFAKTTVWISREGTDIDLPVRDRPRRYASYAMTCLRP